MELIVKLKNDLSSVIRHVTSKGYRITSVFDIGANAGRWTSQYEREVPHARFYLFEANSIHNRPPNIKSTHKWFNVILSNPNTTKVNFYAISGTGDSYYKEQTKHYNQCIPLSLPTTTIDTMVKDNSLTLPQLIKLDTQGAEIDILQGAQNTIKHVDILVIEMPILPYNKGAPTFDEYLKFLKNANFIPVGVDAIQFANGMCTHLDMVFLKKNIKIKYYGDNNLFTNEFKV